MRQVGEPLLRPSGPSGRHVCEILASFLELINCLDPVESDKSFSAFKFVIFMDVSDRERSELTNRGILIPKSLVPGYLRF